MGEEHVMFEWKITIGNVLTIATFAIASIYGFANVQSKIASNQESIAEMKRIYVSRELVDSKFEDIKSRLERMEKKIDNIK